MQQPDFSHLVIMEKQKMFVMLICCTVDSGYVLITIIFSVLMYYMGLCKLFEMVTIKIELQPK